MKDGFQFTLLSLRISKVFVTQPDQKHWNYEVARAVGVDPSLTLGVLKQLRRKGWLDTEMDTTAHSHGGRPTRVFYCMTESGAQAMTAALQALQLSTAAMIAQ